MGTRNLIGTMNCHPPSTATSIPLPPLQIQVNYSPSRGSEENSWDYIDTGQKSSTITWTPQSYHLRATMASMGLRNERRESPEQHWWCTIFMSTFLIKRWNLKCPLTLSEGFPQQILIWDTSRVEHNCPFYEMIRNIRWDTCWKQWCSNTVESLRS